MDPFAAGLAVLFGAAGSVEATFTPASGVPLPDPIRVIRGQPDRQIEFGGGKIVEGTNLFEIRRSDVAHPRKGDRLTIGGVTFRLLGEAMLDLEGITWTIGATELAP